MTEIPYQPRKSNPSTSDIRREQKRAHYRRKRAKGLCGYCGQRVAILDKCWCEICRQYHTDYERYKRTGMSGKDFRRLWNEQYGLCGICKQILTPSAHADHDHNNKKFRGILCTNCNRGLGHFQESPIFLTNAISYLAKHA